MNSGLYAFAGASATATAAAWAKRLLEPMTKVSKVYCGLSRVGSDSRRPPAPDRCPPAPRPGSEAPGSAASASTCGRGAWSCLPSDEAPEPVGGPRYAVHLVDRLDRSAGSVQARVDDDGDPQVPAELAVSASVIVSAQPLLDDVLGELVGHATSRAVSPTTPSSGLSRMKARCWGVTVSSQRRPGPRPDLGRRVTASASVVAPSPVGPRWSAPASALGHAVPSSRCARSSDRDCVHTVVHSGDRVASDVRIRTSSTACRTRSSAARWTAVPEADTSACVGRRPRTPRPARAVLPAVRGEGPATRETLTTSRWPAASGCPQARRHVLRPRRVALDAGPSLTRGGGPTVPWRSR